MRPIFALLMCLVAMPCSAAGYDWMVAQAAPAVVSAQCSCGPDCPCSQEALEKYQTYKLYHDRMEEWLKSQGHRATSRVVQTAAPVVVSRPVTTYSEPVYMEDGSVCVNGRCSMPSQSRRTYTNGAYTNWMGDSPCVGGNCPTPSSGRVGWFRRGS